MNLHDLILKFEAEFESFIALIRSHPAIAAEAPADFSPAAPAGVTPPLAQPSAPAAAVPVPLPPGGNTTDPTAPGFEMPAQTAPAPAEPSTPAVDTSADTLDFSQVRGIGIDLGGGKTIVNCPAHVRVKVNLATGQSGAHNSYTVKVNDFETFMPDSQAEYQSNNYGLDITGPAVTVSADSPGLQMWILEA